MVSEVDALHGGFRLLVIETDHAGDLKG